MKKTEVYKREYKKSEEKNYFELIHNIKENSFTDITSPGKYSTFDGNYFLRISMDLSKKYDSPNSDAKITIEKMGKDVDKESEIEITLKKEGFKKEKQK